MSRAELEKMLGHASFTGRYVPAISGRFISCRTTDRGFLVQFRSQGLRFLVFYLIIAAAWVCVSIGFPHTPFPRIGLAVALMAALILHGIAWRRRGTLFEVDVEKRSISVGGELFTPFAIVETGARSQAEGEFRGTGTSAPAGRTDYLYLVCSGASGSCICVRLIKGMTPDDFPSTTTFSGIRRKISEALEIGSFSFDRYPAGYLKKSQVPL